MAVRLAALVVFTILYGIYGQLRCLAQQDTMSVNRASLQYGLGLLKDRSEGQLTQIEYDEIAPGIRSEVDNYLARTLTSEARPNKDSQMRVRIFSTTEPSENDLVEYRWMFKGVSLRMVQSRNALKIEIPFAGRSRLKDVKTLVGSIVKLEGTDIYGREYEVRLRWPDKLSDGVQFSSNPSLDLLSIITWPDRVDAFVANGRLSILIYKKIDQLATYQDGSRWFETSSR